MLSDVYRLIDELRTKAAQAPETVYREGYLDALNQIESVIYDELGEDE